MIPPLPWKCKKGKENINIYFLPHFLLISELAIVQTRRWWVVLLTPWIPLHLLRETDTLSWFAAVCMNKYQIAKYQYEVQKLIVDWKSKLFARLTVMNGYLRILYNTNHQSNSSKLVRSICLALGLEGVMEPKVCLQ